MKKITALLLFLTMTLPLCPAAYGAGGAGTVGNPYLISSPAELRGMGNNLSAHYRLTRDIDMQGEDFIPPGGDADGPFTGSLDGSGYAVKNLSLNLADDKYVGLFGCLDGTVKNLRVEGISAAGYRYVGAVAGYAGENSMIEGCTVSGTLTGVYQIIDVNVGGIAGFAAGEIRRCVSNISEIVPKASNTYPSLYIGGLAGKAAGVKIVDCVNNWSFSWEGSIGSLTLRAGGLIGSASEVEIIGSVNNGMISGENRYGSPYTYPSTYAGGFVGEASGAKITGGVNKGSIHGNYSSGGFVGYGTSAIEISGCTNMGGISSRAYSGGIIGDFRSGEFVCEKNMNYGDIRQLTEGSNNGTGGIAGYLSGTGSIKKCYNGGNVRNFSLYAGGILGQVLTTGLMIEQCSNSGETWGNYYTSWLGGAVYSYYAGIVGYNYSGAALKISDCSNTGNLPLSIYSYRRAIAGYTTASISRTYSLSGAEGSNYQLADTYSGLDITRPYYLNQSEMQNKNNFPDLDFETVWDVRPGRSSGFPVLRGLPEHLMLDQSFLSLAIGQTAPLTAFFGGVVQNITWSSSDTAVASVSGSGTVRAIDTGYATVTATDSEGRRANCLVYVSIRANGFAIENATVERGASVTLDRVLSPAASSETVQWSSSDELIATVSQTGVVKGVSRGIVTVTGVTTGSNLTASCTVTVTLPATSVSVSPAALSLTVGSQSRLTATVQPQNHDSRVDWSSTNESVATVADGLVSALSPGTAVVTVTTDNNKSAQCTVTVTQPAASVAMSANEITLHVGFTEQLGAAMLPQNTTDTVTWTTSSSATATVSGGLVRGVKTGVATITATTTSGKKAYCVVNVLAAAVPVTAVGLDKTSLLLTPAQASQLTATVSPSNATDKTLAWASSNPAVAEVSPSGVVTAISYGTAVVTATSVNGFYQECAVKVVSASGPSLILDSEKASPGGTARMSVSIVKNPGIAAYQLAVHYDEGILTPIRVNQSQKTGGTLRSGLDEQQGSPLNVLWYASEDFTGDEVLFTVDFAADASADVGDLYEFYVTYGPNDICNTAQENLALYTNRAYGEIQYVSPGDLYEDGVLDVHDIVLLSRYLNRMQTLSPRRMEAADLMEDGEVDIKDIVKLAQWLLGAGRLNLGAALFADGASPAVTVGTVAKNASGLVDIPVTISGNPGIAGFNLRMEYPKDALEIIDISPNGELLAQEGFSYNLNPEDGGGFYVTWYQETNMTADGALFTIRARVKDGFSGDAAPVSIVPAANNFCNQILANVEADYTAGYVLSAGYLLSNVAAEAGGRFSFDLYLDNTYQPALAAAVVALYDGSNAFIGMGKKEIVAAPGRQRIEVVTDSAAYSGYQIFIWHNLETLRPLKR